VRTHRVVIDAPGFDQGLGFGDAGEPVFVQAFVAKLAVETFDEGVFDRLARPDESQLHTVGVGPGVERAGR